MDRRKLTKQERYKRKWLKLGKCYKCGKIRAKLSKRLCCKHLILERKRKRMVGFYAPKEVGKVGRNIYECN